MTRCIIADDRRIVRLAIKDLLEDDANFQIVGEVSEADDLLALLGTTQSDVVLLDWELPDVDMLDLLARLRAQSPRVIVIAMSGRPEAREQSLAAGANGFVSKGDPPDCVLIAIRAILASGTAAS